MTHGKIRHGEMRWGETRAMHAVPGNIMAGGPKPAQHLRFG